MWLEPHSSAWYLDASVVRKTRWSGGVRGCVLIQITPLGMVRRIALSVRSYQCRQRSGDVFSSMRDWVTRKTTCGLGPGGYSVRRLSSSNEPTNRS